MTLYKRGNIWSYNFMVKGKRYQESTGCKSKKEAAQIEKVAKKAVILKNNRRKTLSDRMTVEDAVAKIAAEEYQHSKDGERSIRQIQLAVSFLPKARKYVDQIVREDLIVIRDAFLKLGNKPQTANKKLAPFRKMVKMAFGEWQVAQPITMPKDLKFTTKKRRIMEYAEEAIMADMFHRILEP